MREDSAEKQKSRTFRRVSEKDKLRRSSVFENAGETQVDEMVEERRQGRGILQLKFF